MVAQVGLCNCEPSELEEYAWGGVCKNKTVVRDEDPEIVILQFYIEPSSPQWLFIRHGSMFEVHFSVPHEPGVFPVPSERSHRPFGAKRLDKLASPLLYPAILLSLIPAGWYVRLCTLRVSTGAMKGRFG